MRVSLSFFPFPILSVLKISFGIIPPVFILSPYYSLLYLGYSSFHCVKKNNIGQKSNDAFAKLVSVWKFFIFFIKKKKKLQKLLLYIGKIFRPFSYFYRVFFFTRNTFEGFLYFLLLSSSSACLLNGVSREVFNKSNERVVEGKTCGLSDPFRVV